MFHLDDDALNESAVAIYQDMASIRADGLIVFKGSHHKELREKHNACIILLSWETAEEYGIQRIKHGSETPLSRAQWRKKLDAGLLRKRVEERANEIRKIFASQKIKFKVIGWQMVTIEFYKRGRNDQILRILPAAKVTPSGTNSDYSEMAQASNESK